MNLKPQRDKFDDMSDEDLALEICKAMTGVAYDADEGSYDDDSEVYWVLMLYNIDKACEELIRLGFGIEILFEPKQSLWKVKFWGDEVPDLEASDMHHLSHALWKLFLRQESA